MSGARPKTLTGELMAAAANATAPAPPVVDRLLQRAREAGVSDVHVTPAPERYSIAFRLDGVLQHVADLPRSAAPTLVARLKVLAQLPTYVVNTAQDGRIPGPPGSSDLRLSVLPTIHGEKAVIRFFAPQQRALSLADLHLSLAATEALQHAVLAPQGVVVLSGPAGSGKSTTIRAALECIQTRAQGARSIVSIEDPVERVMPGITQAQVDPGAGFGYPEALRAFLRQDPEVIYLGEVRDPSTAGVVIEAGLTGHLVLTTLHAGSATQVFSRLLDMGLEPHLLVSAITCVLAQRLLRRLCSCAEDSQPVGCPTCQGTGYAGRLPVAEHLQTSPALRRAILDRSCDETLRGVLGADHRTLVDHALERVAAGETTRAELERVLGATLHV